MHDIDLALLIDRFMRRIHFGLQSKAHTFDTAQVGPGGGIVLLTLSEMGCPGLHALTKRVARDKSQMTRTIRALERKGLVVRTASPHDARVTLVCLTPAGAQVVKDLQHAVAETIAEILGVLPEADEKALKSLLQRALSGSVPP
ncbi:MAG: MarR family winged helix-turn-helix transcriptional regulator [Pseudomonadota bacterium]